MKTPDIDLVEAALLDMIGTTIALEEKLPPDEAPHLRAIRRQLEQVYERHKKRKNN